MLFYRFSAFWGSVKKYQQWDITIKIPPLETTNAKFPHAPPKHTSQITHRILISMYKGIIKFVDIKELAPRIRNQFTYIFIFLIFSILLIVYYIHETIYFPFWSDMYSSESLEGPKSDRPPSRVGPTGVIVVSRTVTLTGNCSTALPFLPPRCNDGRGSTTSSVQRGTPMNSAELQWHGGWRSEGTRLSDSGSASGVLAASRKVSGRGAGAAPNN